MTDREQIAAETGIPVDHPFMDALSGFGGFVSMSVANVALGGSWVDIVLDAYFELLLSSETFSTKSIVTAHAGAQKAIKPYLDDVLEELTGPTPPFKPEVIMGSKKWKKLEDAISESIGAYSPMAQKAITQGQSSAVYLANEAMDDAWTAMAIDMNDPYQAARWRKMPVNAYADMVGKLHTGAPLSDLLDAMPDATNQHVRQQLLRGIALGENADVIGRRIARATDLPAWKAVSISRTSILNSYREASRKTYLANPGLVDGWFWQSARDSRTCMACIARDGTLYPLEEKQPAHAQCRCRMRPRLRNGENRLRETGQQWFDRQPPATQLKMLGPKAHKAWKKGDFTLMDLAGFYIDPQMGAFTTRRSVDAATEFARMGRPFHPQDFPPGWATPLDPVVLEQGAPAAFAKLDEAKKALQNAPALPAGIDEFMTCMGH